MKAVSIRTLTNSTPAILLGVLSGLTIALAPGAVAGGPDDGLASPGHAEHVADDGTLIRPAPGAGLTAHDAATAGVVSDGPSAMVIKNLAEAGHGVRLGPNATTDVWALGKYAYTGTFNSPCGGAPGAGVHVWNVQNHNNPFLVGVIESPEGSRSNDVKVASLNAGDILVHSNEACDGGPGGFEVYNVDDPVNPVHLSSVRINELNPIANALFGGVTDVGVHNLWLFSREHNDYVAVVAESAFDNFRLYDITDPANPVEVSAWGAEEIFDPGVGDETADVGRVLNAALWLLEGFGNSQNRFLHDITINEAGTRAYLSNWDAGLVLLDITDPANPSLVSVALNPADGSLDGEVNSHNAWPSEDGTVVVETEEDFDALVSVLPPSNLTFGESPGNVIPGTAVATATGDAFEASPTGNEVTVTADAVEVLSGPLGGNSYPAAELAGNQPKFADTGPITGEAVWIGRACNGDALLNVGAIDTGTDVAFVRRGACTFAEKLANAAAAGAAAIVIANNLQDTPWGGVRIWDYSDPVNPVLASTFDTTCSANPNDPTCDRAGTFSVHNVQVEGDKAYISWYSDGVLVIDISDPYNPVEVARWSRDDAGFVAGNGGPQDVWGIFKQPLRPWIYASDRNGGLYILKEYGSGSAKQGQN